MVDALIRWPPPSNISHFFTLSAHRDLHDLTLENFFWPSWPQRLEWAATVALSPKGICARRPQHPLLSYSAYDHHGRSLLLHGVTAIQLAQPSTSPILPNFRRVLDDFALWIVAAVESLGAVCSWSG